MNITHLSQEEIVRRIINKDEKVFFQFVRAHEIKLYHYIFNKLGDKEKSEEILQDVFIDFLEALRNFNGNSSLKTYLYSIAKYKVIDELRRKKIKKIIFSALPIHFIEGLSPVIIDDDIEKKELTRKISKVFSMLPHDYEQILRLKYMDGVKVKEISKRLSMPFKATESLLFRARKAFIQLFKKEEHENYLKDA